MIILTIAPKSACRPMKEILFCFEIRSKSEKAAANHCDRWHIKVKFPYYYNKIY